MILAAHLSIGLLDEIIPSSRGGQLLTAATLAS